MPPSSDAMNSFFSTVATTLQLQAPFTALTALIAYRFWRTYRVGPMRDVAVGWALWTARMGVVSYAAALRALGESPSSPPRRLLSALGAGLVIAAIPYLVRGTVNLAEGRDGARSPHSWALAGGGLVAALSVLATAPNVPDAWRLAVLIVTSTASFVVAFGYVAWLLLRIPRDELTTGRQLAAIGFAGYSLKQLWNVQAFFRQGPPETSGSVVVENVALTMVAMGSIALLFDRLRQREVRAEREQRRLEAELAARDRLDSLGRLAGGVAHDFNNMLTAILGNAQVARMRQLDGESVLEELDDIESTASRASALTKQLLTFARRERIQPVAFDLAPRVRRLQRFLERQLPDTVAFSLRVDDGVMGVRADPERVEQAIVNLVTNARDALPDERGAISVSVSLAPDTLDGRDAVRVEVRDTGSGMDESVRSRLFEPFFTTKGVSHGTGLGLSIVHGAVMQAGGRIEVHSAPGEGARFELLFPRVDIATPIVGEATVPSRAVLPDRDVPPVPVLVVDDDPLVRRVCRRLLEKHGYAVAEAIDAEDAWRVHGATADTFRLLLTDIVMPGANGRTLARQLVAREPGLAVVYMSGYEADAFEEEPHAPAGAFIAKPFTEAQFIGAIRNALAAEAASA